MTAEPHDNTNLQRLTRDAGPSGWIDLGAGRYALDGWELFEGDADSPHMCRGWFRCTADAFTAPPGTGLTLELMRRDESTRRLDVRIVRVKTTAPEWEFVAER
jgi:hypothetical protein